MELNLISLILETEKKKTIPICALFSELEKFKSFCNFWVSCPGFTKAQSCGAGVLGVEYLLSLLLACKSYFQFSCLQGNTKPTWRHGSLKANLRWNIWLIILSFLTQLPYIGKLVIEISVNWRWCLKISPLWRYLIDSDPKGVIIHQMPYMKINKPPPNISKSYFTIKAEVLKVLELGWVLTLLVFFFSFLYLQLQLFPLQVAVPSIFTCPAAVGLMGSWCNADIL